MPFPPGWRQELFILYHHSFAQVEKKVKGWGARESEAWSLSPRELNEDTTEVMRGEVR